MDTPRRSAVPVVLLAGVTGTFAWLVLRARRSSTTAPGAELDRPTTPVGRYGEPGPRWSVVESLPVARPAGEVAQHLYDHGGLPGLRGGLEGPVMDRIEWDVEGTGHFEAEVHAKPGADHCEVTVRVAPQKAAGRSAVEHAASVLPLVGGPSLRSQVSRSLSRLQRLLETTQPGSPERTAALSADAG